jgi:hypothetical protein
MNTNGSTNGPTNAPPTNGARKPAPPKPAPITAGAPSQRSFLAEVKTGKLEQPLRVVVHGPQGVGKSTLAAGAPEPIFIGAEDGSAALDVARFPQPSSLDDVIAMVHELTRTPTPYQTVVIDSLDWLEPMVWQHVCEAANSPRIKAIEDFGYGKGYVAALDEWRRLLIALDQLRAARRMHVVMIAHTAQKKTKNPAGDDWDRFAMKLNEKAAGLVSEWADDVLFAQFEFFTERTRESRDGKEYQAKGVSTGKRLLYTTWNAAYDAKNRHGLPESIELSWPAFYELATAQTNEERAIVLADIDGLLPRVAPDVAAKASAERSAPLQRLRAIAARLRELATAPAAPAAATAPDTTTAGA